MLNYRNQSQKLTYYRLYLYGMFRIDTSTETENKSMVPRAGSGWRDTCGEEWEQLLIMVGFPFGRIKLF